MLLGLGDINSTYESLVVKNPLFHLLIKRDVGEVEDSLHNCLVLVVSQMNLTDFSGGLLQLFEWLRYAISLVVRVPKLKDGLQHI